MFETFNVIETKVFSILKTL